jgi:hypothetical protein
MNALRWTARVTLLAAGFGLWSAAAPAQPASSVAELTRRADVVFRGTVQRAGATNLSAVPAAEDTAVVRIDEILKSPPDVRDFVGRDVTVKLRAPGSAKVGGSALFFATTWLYGESLGLVEVGRVQAGAPGARSQVSAAERQRREDEIRGHLDSAPLIVAGRVVETRPLPLAPEHSEHSPVWWEAVIRVDAVIKGAAADHLVLLYPTSMDVAWFNAPKPRVGWDAVWLLNPAQGDLMKGRAGVYTALEPWNVMSRDDAGLVKRLVRP